MRAGELVVHDGYSTCKRSAAMLMGATLTVVAYLDR